MSEVEAELKHYAEIREKYEAWKNTLDLDAPRNHKLEKAKEKLKVKSQDELRQSIKVQKRWRGAGSANKEFSKVEIIQPSALSPWEIERAMVPERVYKVPKVPPMKVDRGGKEFGEPPLNALSKRYRQVLEKNMESYKEFLYRPSKYAKPVPQPSVTHSKKFIPSRTTAGNFNYSTSTLAKTK